MYTVLTSTMVRSGTPGPGLLCITKSALMLLPTGTPLLPNMAPALAFGEGVGPALAPGLALGAGGLAVAPVAGIFQGSVTSLSRL